MTEGKDGLPLFARIRVEQAMPCGRVEIIRVRPQHLAPTVEVEAWDLRSDADVRGLNLEVARGEVLEVGETLLQVTGRCHPCTRMDETLGSGGFVAMFGHGGWTASIVQTGTIRRGDVVRLQTD